MSLDAMKQALEALEHIHRTGDTQVFDLCYANTVIPALRAAIEQARQWQGLTADEIWDAWCEQAKPERDTKNFVAAFARVVEAKLKEKNT